MVGLKDTGLIESLMSHKSLMIQAKKLSNESSEFKLGPFTADSIKALHKAL